MSKIFTLLFYQPIFNLLIFFYNTISFQDLGIAIILLTAAIKLILWPLGRSSIKSQKALQDLQPKIEELKAKHGNDKVGLSQATMDLYKENKVNPFSSCLPLLLQLPFLWAVYRVFLNGVGNKLELVYPFIYKPEVINTFSLGFLDLAAPNRYLAILAGLAQFWQAKMMMTAKPAVKSAGSQDENMAAIMNKQMLYIMPAVTVAIGFTLPGGLTLYWFVLTLITALQQLVTFRKKSGPEKGAAKVIDGEIIK